MTWKEFKTKYGSCTQELAYLESLGVTDCKQMVDLLLKQDQVEWALWVLMRLLSECKQHVWTLFYAELTLPFLEKSAYQHRYLQRKAIESHRGFLIGAVTREDAFLAKKAALDSQYTFIITCPANMAAWWALNAFRWVNARGLRELGLVNIMFDEGFRLLEEEKNGLQ